MGKILLRETTTNVTDWDSPLSPDHKEAWQQWAQSLTSFRNIQVPRLYLDRSLDLSEDIELHIFSDASEKAISAVTYLCDKTTDGCSRFAFVLGKAKLAPTLGHTIPRLELCGAVLAVELWELVTENLDVKPSVVKFYTDSKVTLGYIANDTRRFYTYVANRVERIRSCTNPAQWNYVPTHLNLADSATRYALADIEARLDVWLHASPEVEEMCMRGVEPKMFPMVDPDFDKEVRCEVHVKATIISGLDTKRYERFSSWSVFVKRNSFLTHIAKSFKREGSCYGWHYCESYKTIDRHRESEMILLKQVQHESFEREIKCHQRQTPLPTDSTILTLSPFIDDYGLLRVGGRLNKATKLLSVSETNPIIVPKGHIAILLVRDFHEKVKHQGRLITEGALRGNGYWIMGSKRTVSAVIHGCVKCRRLRGPMLHQQMADLPLDRVTPGPPFSEVGVDTFGPWEIVTRKTRGGAANSKRWAILFTCLTTRAVHIEVVEEISSSAFINALRRFVSIRGPVKVYRSDRGTDFVGAADELKIETINVEDPIMKKHLYDSVSTWIFNAPHSSHMGGVWERMIGITRRILDAMFLEEKKGLTHDVLTTFWLKHAQSSTPGQSRLCPPILMILLFSHRPRS
ncbi:uncharacterized protein LOC127872309 [Dreissena polymorpha]|uniref:uncharacterized protein LOC127872309 n=1 Tax=Dreissena polymorpha TaxID=45954 RepID=UPI0022656E09|nr:uncharacterized protein LOC127872309 [Dreissena polymorpha]